MYERRLSMHREPTLKDVQHVVELARAFLDDALTLLTSYVQSSPSLTRFLKDQGLNPETVLFSFSFPEELPAIFEVARRYFPENESYPVNPYALLLAIREAERGRKGFEFGIVAVKDTDLRTQAEWACATVKKNFERFRGSGEKDFIAFLGKRWAPIGAENDPKGLNKFWVDNVRYFYNLFRKGEER
jgi:hypothetical protein